MTDIFDATILCKKCNIKMKPIIVNKNGLELRAIQCAKCGDQIIHPADLNGMDHFNDLKDKKFNVKLRMVGNSHAISIPKEIIDFMSDRQREMHRSMDDMVRLWFDDFNTLKLGFFDDEDGFEGVNNVMAEESENQEQQMDNGRVKRRVKNDGRGNIDIVEQENLNDPEKGIRGMRIKKMRRRTFGGKQ